MRYFNQVTTDYFGGLFREVVSEWLEFAVSLLLVIANKILLGSCFRRALVCGLSFARHGTTRFFRVRIGGLGMIVFF